MLPISTVVSERAMHPLRSDPPLHPPMTIILLLFSKATPT